jgi:hypothetical protein
VGRGVLAACVLVCGASAGAEDLAAYFPNLTMPPDLADAAAEEADRDDGPFVKQRDFAAVVAEAKREAMGLKSLGRQSVASNLPSPKPNRTVATTVAHTKPHCRTQKNACPQPQCPPGRAESQPGTQPAQSQPGTQQAHAQAGAQPAQPKAVTQPAPVAPSATPGAVVPLPEVAGSVQPQPQPAVPDLSRQLARADVGGLRETYSDTPVFVGDGCAPFGSPSRSPVARAFVVAPSLTGSAGSLVGSGPYGINQALPSAAQFNNIQAIAGQGPGFVLPSTPYGSVSAAPIPITGTSGIITTVGSPGSFTAAVDGQFSSDPTLAQYAAQNPATVYDPSTSGAVPATSSGLQDAYLFYDYVVDTNVLMPGATVGFVKLTENMSPLPRDRVYMNYSYFRNANFFYERADVNRFVPGFEKTFYDGWTSIEIRTPFAATLSNNQWIQSTGECREYRDIEFGNMSVIFKSLLVERKTWAITGGVQVMLPTAADTNLYFATPTNPQSKEMQSVFVDNQSTHVMPFLGSVWAPNDRFFSQALLQVDVDSNGNAAYVNNNLQQGVYGDSLDSVGRLYMPTFMYMSFGTGYWLYRDNSANFTGFAPIMEVHVNQGMSQFNPITTSTYQLGSPTGVVSVTNALIGCNFEWGQRSTLTFAYVTPLGGGADRFFDGELRALYNWRFGPQNRLTRAQF